MGGRPSVKQISTTAEVIRFGVFEADTLTGELRKHGLRIKLQEQPFQVLSLLLARPGELVTREELRLKLWSADTFVDFEQGLNKLSINFEKPSATTGRRRAISKPCPGAAIGSFVQLIAQKGSLHWPSKGAQRGRSYYYLQMRTRSPRLRPPRVSKPQAFRRPVFVTTP
jgi:hypothetical protein